MALAGEDHVDEGLERQRARFLLDATQEAFAPVNTPFSPETIRRASETSGQSLLDGFSNFFQDLRSRFAKLKTVTLEFVHLMKVGDRVRELASEKEEVNIFVDEFGGFESTEDGQNVWKDLTLPIPEVSTF